MLEVILQLFNVLLTFSEEEDSKGHDENDKGRKNVEFEKWIILH